jgi:hypothetical protein
VVPSQALIGMPDDVPGCNIQQGFFVVAVNGGLDTAIVIQEIGNAPAAGQTARIHWHMRDVRSRHVANSRITYTRNDVIPVSMRELIANNVSPDGLALLLDNTTFGEPVYIGYMTWENDITAGANRFYANNLIGMMYLHDMAAGQAAVTNLAAREYMPINIPNWAPTYSVGGAPPITGPIAAPWLPAQGSANTVTSPTDELFAEFGVIEQNNGIPTMEDFTPNALAASMQRERGYERPTPTGIVTVPPGSPFYPPIGAATGFAMYPRFYLHNATAENFIFIWKSINARAAVDGWRIEINIYDEAENAVSGFVLLPNELNVLDVRTIVPPSHMATYPAAGWMSIAMPDIFGGYCATPTTAAPVPGQTFNEWLFSGIAGVEFLGYNWQLANSTNASLNWSGLFQVARDVNFLTR